jgi:hypothetical protein
LRFAEAYSARTLRQSQPSSSATSIGSAVKMPCPISDFDTRMVTLSSGSITIQPPTSTGPSAALAATAGRSPSIMPPAAVSDAMTKPRRFSVASGG